MVEVPLEIEAELPREFDGAALLASSGLPRKVKIKAQKDALKLSTAYRADQLLADIVKVALRGTAQDVQRVQDAARSFVRTVRERRQDGATLIVTSNGRGKIDVAEKVPSRPPSAPPGKAQPAPEPARVPGQPTLADRIGALEKRLSELESGFARIAERPAAEDRLAQLEERLASIQSHNDLAGPLMEGGHRGPGAVAVARGPAAPRRATAVEAFAEGLRDELRVRITEQLGTSRRSTEICDRAAALSAEAEQTLGAPRDGTSQKLRATAAATAARQHALERIAEEIDMYQAADLPVAAQLVARLEDGPAQLDTPDPAQPLQTQAEALVRAARGPLAEERQAWLARAAALCGWTLIEPLPGEVVRDELMQALDAGGDHIVAVASPGLRAHDGSVLVRARVLVGAPRSEPPPQMATLPPPVGAEIAGDAGDAGVEADAHHPERADAAATGEDRAHRPEGAAAEPDAAGAGHTGDADLARDGAPNAAAGGPGSAAAGAAAPFGNLAGGGDISAAEAAAAAASASAAPHVVGGDESDLEEAALAAQVALAVETEVSADPDWAQVARGPEAFAGEAPASGFAGTHAPPDSLAGAAHAPLASAAAGEHAPAAADATAAGHASPDAAPHDPAAHSTLLAGFPASPGAAPHAEPDAALPWSNTPPAAAAAGSPPLASADPALPWPSLPEAARDALPARTEPPRSPAEDLDVQEVSDDDVEEITAEEVEELIDLSEIDQAPSGPQDGSGPAKPRP